MLDCLQPGLGKLERVKYFNRMLLTAEDMRTDQDFVLQKLRRHNRFLHGWGVVCGLIVRPAPTATQPWRAQIGEGYALGPFGDEVFVGQPVFMDLATCGPGAATNPCEPGLLLDSAPSAGAEIFVAIKYAECRARPVLAMPGGCGCEDEACEYSRIRDSFVLSCLSELPASHRPDPKAPSLCDIAAGKALLACLPCPTEPWVVLAKVALPGSASTPLAEAAITNAPPIRRIVFSTALLQEQLIKCCCKPGEDHRDDREPPRDRRARLEVVKHASQVERRDDRATGEVVAMVRFEMKVTNHGPDDAVNVRVRDDLSGIPLDLVTSVDDFQVAPSGDWGDKVLTGGLEAQLGTLGAAKSAKLSFVVTFKIRGLPPDARIRNTAIASSDTQLDPASLLKAEIDVPVFS
jgi:hypothetical protein